MFRNRTTSWKRRYHSRGNRGFRCGGPEGCEVRGGREGPGAAGLFWSFMGVLALAAGVAGAGASESPLRGISEEDRRAAEGGMVLFEAVYSDVWSAAGEAEANLERLEGAAQMFRGVGDAAARAYLLGRVELYRGRIIQGRDNKAEARPFYARAMELAQESLAEEGGESAETYRLLSDAASSWMLTKGLGALIRTAPQVSEWSKKAVQMDPKNAMAALINIQGQINAPKSAGGDPDEALRRLLELNRRGDLSRVERFWTKASLSAVYRKLKERDKAKMWCARAGEIFPDNPFAKECR